MRLILMRSVGSFPTAYISDIISTFPRKRDYYGTADYSLGFIQIYYILAASLNTTLLGGETLRERGDGVAYVSMPLTAVHENSILNLEANGYKKFHIYEEVPIIYGFVYCSVQSKVGESFLISLLEQTADYATWGGLLASCIGVAAVTAILNGSPYSTNFFEVVTPLLSQGFSRHLETKFKRCILLLWLLLSGMFPRWFEGKMTTSLTVPPPDQTIVSFSELASKNFSLVFYDENLRVFFLNTVVSSIEDADALHVEAQSVDLLAFKNLLVKASVTKTIPETVEKIVNESETFAGALFIAAANQLGIQVQTMMEGLQAKKQSLRRRCYTVRSKISPEVIYDVVTGDNYNIFWEKLNQIIESGIYAWWLNEAIDNMSATRVQDRSRICSNGVVCTGTVDDAISLGLQDRILNVFYGWGILLALSAAYFLFEILNKKYLNPELPPTPTYEFMW